MMSRCQALLKEITVYLGLNKTIVYNGITIDFSGTWDKITITEAFERYSSTNISSALASGKFEKIMCLEIQPKLGNDKPVFIYDYPATLSSLARLSPNDCSIAERFELYCAGIELCNGFTELTDPLEQRYRFQKEINKRKQTDMQVLPMPETFLEALHDLPLTSGNAMGIDRLVMLFSNSQKIDQVVSFIPEEL